MKMTALNRLILELYKNQIISIFIQDCQSNTLRISHLSSMQHIPYIKSHSTKNCFERKRKLLIPSNKSYVLGIEKDTRIKKNGLIKNSENRDFQCSVSICSPLFSLQSCCRNSHLFMQITEKADTHWNEMRGWTYDDMSTESFRRAFIVVLKGPVSQPNAVILGHYYYQQMNLKLVPHEKACFVSPLLYWSPFL